MKSAICLLGIHLSYVGLFWLAVLSCQNAALALTWRNPNKADENTLVLLQFDEASGTTTTSACGNYVFNVDATYGEWSANPGWMRDPSGAALKGKTNIVEKQRAAQSSTQIPVAWSLPAITISFWMRDAEALQQENKVFYFGYGNWRDQQATIGYRPGWSGAARGMFAGTGPMPQWSWSKLTDGAWHHVAMVGEYDAITTNTTFRLFIDNEQQTFMIDDESASEWVFTPTYTSTVSEFWDMLNGCAGGIDEFLVQGEALTDFSNVINAPTGTLITLR